MTDSTQNNAMSHNINDDNNNDHSICASYVALSRNIRKANTMRSCTSTEERDRCVHQIARLALRVMRSVQREVFNKSRTKGYPVNCYLQDPPRRRVKRNPRASTDLYVIYVHHISQFLFFVFFLLPILILIFFFPFSLSLSLSSLTEAQFTFAFSFCLLLRYFILF